MSRPATLGWIGVLLWGVLPWVTGGASVLAAQDPLYAGNWSNGRGEVLLITGRTIKFAGERALAYRDVTQEDKNKTFLLQVLNPGEGTYFSTGNFLLLKCTRDPQGFSMKMRAFRSSEDLLRNHDPRAEVTWYKDQARASGRLGWPSTFPGGTLR